MRIGIHVAWANQEAAYMAGQLADVASSLNHVVSILSTQPKAGSVYPTWDKSVLSHRSDFRAWAKRQKTIVWFDCQSDKVKIAQNLGVKNTLVLLWHRISVADLSSFSLYDKIVCPNQSTLEHALQGYPHGMFREIEWDTQTAYSMPEELPGITRLFVPIDGRTDRKIGPLLARTLVKIVDERPDVHITIGQCAKWSRPMQTGLHILANRAHKRLTVAKRQSWPAWCAHLDATDWLFNPSVGENAMLTNIVASYKRIPTIAFDVPPVDTLLRDGKTGALISCELDENHWRVPTAVPAYKKIVDKVLTVLSDKSQAGRLVSEQTLARLRRRRTLFEFSWDVEFGAGKDGNGV